MPRIWPSMRLTRAASALASSAERGTAGCAGCSQAAQASGDVAPGASAVASAAAGPESGADVIARIADRRAQRGDIGARRIEGHRRSTRLQRHRGGGHAGDGLEYPRDAGHAALAGHALHVEFHGFHWMLLRDGSSQSGRKRRNSSALLTTDTELIAMAAPAITGLSRPKAASGMPSTL